MGNRIPDVGYYLTSSIVPQLYAWIEVDCKPLQIYGATESEKKAIGYIEAEEGKEFIVRFADQRTTRPEYHYSATLFIDGIWNRGFTIKSDDRYETTLDDQRRSRSFLGRRVSPTSEQPFLFSKLATTDSEENACDDEQVIKNLGTIQLRYLRVTNYRMVQSAQSYDVVDSKLIHEKSKKAQVSHQATFGEAKAVPKKAISSICDRIDPESSPFFQIEFRYRSRQLLQLEGYIPDSPVASPSPSSHANTPSESPVASTSNAIPRSRSATQAQQSPQIETDAGRLALLRARHEILQREYEIAKLQLEIATLEGQSGTSGSGGSVSSSARKVKAEPLDDERDLKRIKKEIGEDSSSQANAKKKEKKKAEVIVLSDSD